MGDMSFLRFVPASSATIRIDWTKVPEASKKFLLHGWETDWSDPDMTKKRPLPATIDDLAKMLDGSKFFGYMQPKLCTLLLDISEFGLAHVPQTKRSSPQIGLGLHGPHFYMKYLSKVWFVLFMPGERNGMVGFGPDMAVMDVGEEDKEIAQDKALAEEFDPKLCAEVSRMGTLGATVSNKVAGWGALTLKSSLQAAQMAEAVMELPPDHPAYTAMIRGVFPRAR